MRTHGKDVVDIRDDTWLADLSSVERKAFLRAVTTIDLPAGRRMVHEGDRGRECFVLLAGCAEVRHGDQPVATLEPGDFFGEIATLAHVPRVADVWAMTDVVVGVSTEAELMVLLEDCPTVARHFVRRVGRLAAEGLSNDGLE